MQGKYEDGLHFKILLLGDEKVGKTSLMHQFIKKIDPHTYAPVPDSLGTLGVEQETKIVKFLNRQIKLQLWDAGGNQKIWPLAEGYIALAHSIMVCFDVTGNESFEHAKQLVTDIQRQHPLKPILLVGCKSDLKNKRQISEEHAKEVAQQFGLTYIETSSSKGKNISQPFTSLLRQMHFIHLINSLKPRLNKAYNHYLSIHDNHSSSFFSYEPSEEEKKFKIQYEEELNKFFQAKNASEIGNFYINITHIIKQMPQPHRHNNSLLNNIAEPMLLALTKNPFKKVLQETLTILREIPKEIIDLTNLEHLTLKSPTVS